MNFFPFFILIQLFILQFLLCQISDQNEDFYFNAQIIANDLTEQPKLSPNGNGRFRLALAKITHKDLRDYQTRLEDETDLNDFAQLKIPPNWIDEMVPSKTGINPRMAIIHRNNVFAFKVSTVDGRKRTNYIQFKMTELTLKTYFIILEDAPFSGIDAKIYDELSISANIYPHDRTYLDPRTIDQCLTSEQWDLIKQKIPEALHSSTFNALKNEKNPFRHPQIKIRRRKNHYKIDVHEGEHIQQIEQRQQISLPFSLPSVPQSMPSRNSALERFKQPPAKKGKTTAFMIPLPSSPLKPKTPPKTPSSSSMPKKLALSPESISKNSVPSPEPIDLDTPPMSPKNIREEENMTINLDDILNTVNLDTLPTSPGLENTPANLDDTLNIIDNDETRRLLLDRKGKRPMEYDEAGTSKNGINPGNLKLVELNKIITAPKRKIAQIYENGNSVPLENNDFDEKELKWGRQQKRGSHSNLAELENLGVISGGGGKVKNHQKPKQIAYVDNEPESTMSTDDEEGNERGKFKMDKFAKSLIRAHHSQMKNNLEEGESSNSKVHHNFNEINIPGHANDDLIYLINDDKKLANYHDDVIDRKVKRKLNFN